MPHPASAICAAVVLVTTLSTALFAWIVSPTYGRGRWVAVFWAAYGCLMTGLCFVSMNLALFCFGVVTPLLSQNVGQLVALRALGADAHRQQVATVIHRGGRLWFLGGSLLVVALRASIGGVLLLVSPHGPAAWLGAGLLASPLGNLTATIRLALQPPKMGDRGPDAAGVA